MRARPALAVALALALGACARDSDAEARLRSRSSEVPTAVDVAVTLYGAPARLDLPRRAADFVEGEHRFWRLAGALGSKVRPGDIVVAFGDRGRSVTYSIPDPQKERQPVLSATEGGELAAEIVRVRAGSVTRSSEARVAPLRRIEVSRGERSMEPAGGDAGAGEDVLDLARKSLLQLELSVDGRTVPGPALAELEAMAGESGKRRPMYSLRELSSRVAGPGARVVALIAEDGKRRAVPAAKWRDREHVPVLRSNRRGAFKLHWLSPSGQPGPAELRQVARIEIETSTKAK